MVQQQLNIRCVIIRPHRITSHRLLLNATSNRRLHKSAAATSQRNIVVVVVGRRWQQPRTRREIKPSQSPVELPPRYLQIPLLDVDARPTTAAHVQNVSATATHRIHAQTALNRSPTSHGDGAGSVGGDDGANGSRNTSTNACNDFKPGGHFRSVHFARPPIFLLTVYAVQLMRRRRHVAENMCEGRVFGTHGRWTRVATCAKENSKGI